MNNTCESCFSTNLLDDNPVEITINYSIEDQKNHNENITATVCTKPAKSCLKSLTEKFIRKTPTMRKLQRYILKYKKKKYIYPLRLKIALRLSKKKAFRNCCKKYKTITCLFTVEQYREIMKEYVTRRKFTENEKLKAFFLYRKGAKQYKWLSKIFVLPSVQSLKQIIAKTEGKQDLNKTIFKHLAKRTKKMTRKGKHCILLFDEIAIQPRAKQGKKPDHALVFIVQGIRFNYKLPITYKLSKGPTNVKELKDLITSIIIKLFQCGFNVIATVCNHKKRNITAINELALETRMEYQDKGDTNYRYYNAFEVNNKLIIPFYDSAHLTKSIRNNFMKMNLELKDDYDVVDGKAKVMGNWDDIVKFYEWENKEARHLMPKVTQMHVRPTKFAKKKLRFAIQIFCQRLAAVMHLTKGFSAHPTKPFYVNPGNIPVVMFFNELFESMNGNLEEAKEKTYKKLIKPVSLKSKHKEFWTKAKKTLESTRFINKNGQKVIVPSITYWLRTIEHAEIIRDKLLLQYRMRSFWMSRFTLRAMEEFIKSICSHGYRKIFPTEEKFEEVFKTLMLNGYYRRLTVNDWTVKRKRRSCWWWLRNLLYNK